MATVTSFAIAIEDFGDQWEVRIFAAAGEPGRSPSAAVRVDAGYVMTGGGGGVDRTGAGILLTATYPSAADTWEVRAKEHMAGTTARVTAYAIGLRPRNGARLFPGRIVNGARAAYSTAEVFVGYLLPGEVITGGGARDDDRTRAGNLLTAAYPATDLRTWHAVGKDPDPASLTACAIGLWGFRAVPAPGR